MKLANCIIIAGLVGLLLFLVAYWNPAKPTSCCVEWKTETHQICIRSGLHLCYEYAPKEVKTCIRYANTP